MGLEHNIKPGVRGRLDKRMLVLATVGLHCKLHRTARIYLDSVLAEAWLKYSLVNMS